MFLLLKDLEIENEDLRERLRKIQQEQRILLDKVNGLQLQLNEVNSLNFKEKTQSCCITCSSHPQSLFAWVLSLQVRVPMEVKFIGGTYWVSESYWGESLHFRHLMLYMWSGIRQLTD